MKNGNIVYDEAEIKVKKVDNQIAFIVENKTDETIFILFEDEYDYLNQNPLEIYPYSKLCFHADGVENVDSAKYKLSNKAYFITGNMAEIYLKAFENHKFVTMYENTYREEYMWFND